MGYTRADWSAHFSEGRDFRQLGDDEKRLIAEHAPPPAGGRALDACCGTGELAAFLATLGYTVDATDFAEGALARARAERSTVEGCAGCVWTSKRTTRRTCTRTATTW
ncbi:class I SAM-dependent methyltransferase [Streptomyces nitrosporeus]|uniref:class I SAM-dependent methyltransferase n=1 Tax=Streptomyces nitrosporeus TaxID=28894 RepID=UPI003333AA39